MLFCRGYVENIEHSESNTPPKVEIKHTNALAAGSTLLNPLSQKARVSVDNDHLSNLQSLPRRSIEPGKTNPCSELKPNEGTPLNKPSMCCGTRIQQRVLSSPRRWDYRKIRPEGVRITGYHTSPPNSSILLAVAVRHDTSLQQPPSQYKTLSPGGCMDLLTGQSQR